jgi:hypothetical protein
LSWLGPSLLFLGIPAVFALSFLAWRRHRRCPLARGALVLAVVEVGLLLLLLIGEATIPHLP